MKQQTLTVLAAYLRRTYECEPSGSTSKVRLIYQFVADDSPVPQMRVDLDLREIVEIVLREECAMGQRFVVEHSGGGGLRAPNDGMP
jgi:hypothetical protein